MKTVLIALLAALALAASASAAPVDWTKAGAISAVKAAPIWKGAAGVNGSGAILHTTAVLSATPYGRTRKVAGKRRATMWNITFTVNYTVPATVIGTTTTPASTETATSKACVKALGPLRGAQTAFQVGGWILGSLNGGCAHYADSGNGSFEWGGSKAVLTHP